jgi:SAM-dependent methyltransferase
MYAKGFKNTCIVEIAQGAIDSFIKRYPDFPKENIIHADFFDIIGSFDLIIEQTFFCAINPELRRLYVQQMTKLLKTNGKLVGLLFNTDFAEGPPFGGTKNEYFKLFDSNFSIDVMTEAHNSIEPRQGKELFIILRKK